MLKALIVNPASGKQIVILGLTSTNLARLTADKPIAVQLSELGLEPIDVVIMFGPTTEDIVETLRKAGGITDETSVIDRSNLRPPPQA